ncbi:MAG: hypothetical protein MUF49_08830 [Oculatellaceae cyanobacterium Prado106]|nr:hypothetical protein [Oculatellaceae cyanobacterium Prado106]
MHLRLFNLPRNSRPTPGATRAPSYSKGKIISLVVLFPAGLTALVISLGYFRAVAHSSGWLSLDSSEIFPTGIPWLQTEAECERSQRIWKDGQCWDEEHDPSF